jgi:hypothetical protein
MPRCRSIAALVWLPMILAACGPGTVTGRPPPNPPGSPAVSTPGARDAAAETGPAAARPDAGSSADAVAKDAYPETAEAGTHADATTPSDGTQDVSAIDARADAAPASDAHQDAGAAGDAHLDAAAVTDGPQDAAGGDARSTDGAVDHDAAGAFDGEVDVATDGALAPGARLPSVGEVVIDEVLANPSGSDLGREWIEVASRSSDLLDLSLLHVADATTDIAVSAGLLPPGGLLVLGQSVDPTKNGGAPVSAAYGTRLILNNDGEQVSVCLGPCATGVVLDQVSWGTTGPAYDGHALVIDPVTRQFCPAQEAFGTAGDFGTPGRPNPACSTPDASSDGTLVGDAGDAAM